MNPPAPQTTTLFRLFIRSVSPPLLRARPGARSARAEHVACRCKRLSLGFGHGKRGTHPAARCCGAATGRPGRYLRDVCESARFRGRLVERGQTRWGFGPVTGQRASCYDRPLDLGSGPRTGPTSRHMVLRQITNRTIHRLHGEASNTVNIHFYNDLPLTTPGAISPPNRECNLLLRPVALPGG